MFTRIRADSIRRAFQGALVLWVVGFGSRCPTAMVAWAQGTNDPPPIDAGEESTRSPRNPGDGRLGESPEDTSQLFLRQATVLLKPGEMQFDHGFTYSLQEVIHPTVLSDGTLSTERVRTRQWLVPLAIRLGLKENVQGFIDLPFGYTHIERADLEFDDFARAFGSRDVTGGVSVLLRQEQDPWPDLIGTLSFSAPLGDDAFGTGANDLSLGSGFWGVSGNLNAVKAYDPAVLFGSLGYSHYFERSIFGNRFQPGESISYSLGMGMAMNDEITLSAALIGAYQFDTRINGQRALRTSFEPILLRLAVTITALKCHIVEPFVRLGMTDDASNASFGVIITRMFH